MYLGPEYLGPHEEALLPITTREVSIAVPLVVLAIWFGVYPATVLDLMNSTIDQQTETLAGWTEEYDRLQALNNDVENASITQSDLDIPTLKALSGQRLPEDAVMISSSGSSVVISEIPNDPSRKGELR